METRSTLFWQNKMTDDIKIQNEIKQLGLEVDIKSGHLFYSNGFIPMQLNNIELVFVRHGETYGNCGQATANCKIDYDLVSKDERDATSRVYQGNVDTEINQLTNLGKQQAKSAADKLTNEFINYGWIPDNIFISPLNRAKETALPFIERHHLDDKCIIHPGIIEMSFGLLDNRRICDIPPEHASHLFYQQQHALVKHSGLNNNGIDETAESFCDVILRARTFLNELNEKYSGKKIIVFSHSMFGAACSILLGRGQKIDNNDYLAFDGKREDDTYYTLPHATPILLTPNFQMAKILLKI